MKVRQQHVHRAEFIPRRDKDICCLAKRFYAAEFRTITGTHCRTFQCAHGRRSDRNNAARAIDDVRLVGRNLAPFAVHFVLGQIFGFNGHPCPRPNVQCDMHNLGTAGRDFIHQFRRKMQPRRRCRHRPQWPGIDRLIPVAVGGFTIALHIRGQRHFSHPVQHRKNIVALEFQFNPTVGIMVNDGGHRPVVQC